MAEDFIKPILRDLDLYLRPHGFKRQRARYVRTLPDMLQFIDLQKSRTSTRYEVAFTLNVAVFSPVLASLNGDRDYIMGISDCHWNTRLGQLIPAKADTWWKVMSSNEAEVLAPEIVRLVDCHVMSELDARSTLAQLGAQWLAGEYGGLTGFARNEYMQVLRDHPELLRTSS